MLEPWIIEKIRRREDERNRERDARRLELPIYEDRLREDVGSQEQEEEKPQRGVVVIDL